MEKIFFAWQLIFLPYIVKGWEFGVASMGHVDFFSNGSILQSIVLPDSDFRAIELDSANNRLFLSDDVHDYSIFVLNLTDEKHVLTPLIKRQNRHVVQDIAYDLISDTLYWTIGNGGAILWHNLSNTSSQGQVLHSFDEEIPQGIVVDSCRRMLYWSNANHLRPTIERSRLDGSEREVLVQTDLYQPVGIALDIGYGKIYWADDKDGIYYDIQRANLDGSNIEILTNGRHHMPFSIAVGPTHVFWSDWISRAVWSIPKYSNQRKQEPVMVHEYNDDRLPMRMVYWSTMKIGQECDSLKTTTVIPSTSTEDSHLSISMESLVIKNKTNYCLNDGVLIRGLACHCPQGFMGTRCERHVCYNYCLHDGRCAVSATGSPVCSCRRGYEGRRCEHDICEGYCLNGAQCTLDSDALPRCVCQRGYEGVQCEHDMCEGYCLNGGSCELDEHGQPSCKCDSPFSGARCEERTDLAKLCKIYCQYGAVYVPVENGVTPLCSCSQSTAGGGEYEVVRAENSTSVDSFVTSSALVTGCQDTFSLSDGIAVALGCVCILLSVFSAVLIRSVIKLRKRPRIKKRIIVNKNITPLTTRPPQEPPEQCEITIENCCNMNICETPCFEPQLRTPKSSHTEEKRTLLGSMEETSSSSPCQNEMY